MKIAPIFLALSLTLSAPFSSAFAADFTAIDVPGGFGSTLAHGINPQGDIVGGYSDSHNVSHGFLLSQGTFTPIDVPGAVDTNALGINQQGDIVGTVLRIGSGFPHGFLLSQGTFTPIDVPGALDTGPWGIN